MELQRTQYPALLGSLQPGQATTVLNDRVKLINKINNDIADWLHERRRLEDQYATGLRKLARRPQQDGGALLGIFQIPWQRILESTEALAQSHETLGQKIEADVERPLKEYASTHAELRSMPTIQNDLASLVKTLETAQKKADKVKGTKKSGSAQVSMDEANQQWESRAPYVFEQLQAADEDRLNHLRDVLTQYETHHADHFEKSRASTEACLNALLNVETADEISTFAAKVSGGRHSTQSRRQGSTASATNAMGAASVASAAGLPPPPRIPDDATSQYSGRSGHGRTTPAIAEPRQTPEPRQGAFGGLRRLGTVMGRRKSVVLPAGDYTSERKSRMPFAPFRRGESRTMQRANSASPPPEPIAEVVSNEEAAVDASRNVTSSDSHGNHDLEAIRSIPESEPGQTLVPIQTNGTNIASHEVPDTPEVTVTAEAPSQPPQVDQDGFSHRPNSLDDISRAQREAAAAEEPGLNLTIRDQPIHEDEGEAQQAMDEMANALRLKAQQTGIRRNLGTLRGRRDVRNTIFVPSPPTTAQESPSAPVIPVSPQPPRQLASRGSTHDDPAMSDTTSVHSSHTLHNISGSLQHPELYQPGLNASVIETVSAWFTQGAATKSFVVGELALAYNPTGSSSDRETIRLDNFPILEKVAANPAFVTEIDPASKKGKEKENGEPEKTGEYDIQVSSISRPAPTVAFKYQVHLDPSNLGSYAPILFTPLWNLEEHQASVIITYALNPAFASSIALSSITLKNLVLTVNLDLTPQEDEVTKQPREAARAASVVMFPNSGATFRRKQSAVVWKIPELEVKAAADGQRFLARFTTTDSWPRQGKVEAKFEYRTEDSFNRLGVSQYSESATDQAKEIDPFADESVGSPGLAPKTWTAVPTVRTLAAGKYVAV